MAPTIIVAGGKERYMGLLPRKAAVGSLLFAPHYEDSFVLTPREKWRPLLTDEAIKAHVDYYIANGILASDQNGFGSCAANACAMGVEQATYDAGITPLVRLASGRLYHLSGGGYDGGSTLSDNLLMATNFGIPKITSRQQELDYRSNWTEEETKDARCHAIIRASDCPTFDYMGAFVDTYGSVIHGVNTGRNYDTDSSGLWISRPAGSGGGHGQVTPPQGVCHTEEHGWGLLTCGSWSEDFGYKGWYVIPEAYFAAESFTDGFGIAAVVFPSGTPNP